MIRFILLQNRAGKTRLAKYYIPLDEPEKHSHEYDVHRLISTRDPKFTNFVEVMLLVLTLYSMPPSPLAAALLRILRVGDQLHLLLFILQRICLA